MLHPPFGAILSFSDFSLRAAHMLCPPKTDLRTATTPLPPERHLLAHRPRVVMCHTECIELTTGVCTPRAPLSPVILTMVYLATVITLHKDTTPHISIQQTLQTLVIPN